jgi:hypothetical protein
MPNDAMNLFWGYVLYVCVSMCAYEHKIGNFREYYKIKNFCSDLRDKQNQRQKMLSEFSWSWALYLKWKIVPV